MLSGGDESDKFRHQTGKLMRRLRLTLDIPWYVRKTQVLSGIPFLSLINVAPIATARLIHYLT